MDVLIVESVPELGRLWQKHLGRHGMDTHVVQTQEQAIEAIASGSPQVLVLDLILDEGSALAVADYAEYRCPGAQVIFVTNTRFFSDGSIFAHVANARAFVQSTTPPDDLAAMVQHYAARC